MADTLGIVLASSDHGRVHAAFLMAAGAAALGRSVVLFATGAGVRALTHEAAAAADAALQARGVVGVAELRAAAMELGARLIACESGLRGEGIDPDALLPGVTTEGMASFLEATRQAQLIGF